MKKFFTAIPLQKKLNPHIYEPIGNSRLCYETPNRFPILSAINAYAQENEEIEIIAVATNNEDVRNNQKFFDDEVAALCAEKNIKLAKGGIQYVTVPENEDVQTQLKIFLTLTDYVEDQDELYICMTYGTKPMSMVMTMAVQYAYRIKKNTCIGCAVYGKIVWSGGKAQGAEVYDMTALIQMNELVHTLAAQHVENPRGFLDMLLQP